MSETIHRIPWQRLDYAYTEIKVQSGEPFDYAKAAQDAITMEDAYYALLPAHTNAEPERVREPERNDEPSSYQGGQRSYGNGNRGGSNYGNQRRDDPDAPNCPEHRSPMKRNRRNNGWFCTKKDRGEFCSVNLWDNDR